MHKLELPNPKLVLYVSIIIIVQICTKHKVETNKERVLPIDKTTGLGCILEGRNVSYVCTVDDDGSRLTLWRGSAFNCPSFTSVISLAHSLFEPNGVSGSCGDLSAMSVGVSGNNYTSRLTVTATTGLNGMTIECTRSGIVVFGNDTLRTGVPPPPPQRTMVNITSTVSLTISWTPPSDTSNVGGYIFTVTGEDCGCGSMTFSSDTTSVLCSGWIVNNQACSFEVRTISQDCGFTSAPVNESVVLMVPPAPTQLRVVFSAHQIEVEFMQAESLPLSNFTVTYTVVVVGTNISINFTGLTCDETNIRCNLNLTFHNLTSDSYIVSVFASNIFGSGPLAVYVECNPEKLSSNLTSLNGSGMVNVSNGLIQYSGVSPGSVATLQCNDGYRANSFLNRTCMFGGQWSNGALRCVIIVDGGTMDKGTISPQITTACPLYCGVLVGVFVFGTMLVLIIVCIAIALCILKKYRRECFASNNTSEKVQLRAVNRESPTTNESPLSSVDKQPSKPKINVHRSEPSKSAPMDTYANPEDFIKTPPHMQPQKNQGAEDQGEVLKPLSSVDVTDDGVQYESIEVARPVKVTSTQPSQQVYSEVFDALPEGKSTIIIKKATVTKQT